MARYPAMVRRRIIELYELDYSTSEIAEVFGVCEVTPADCVGFFRHCGYLDTSNGAQL